MWITDSILLNYFKNQELNCNRTLVFNKSYRVCSRYTAHNFANAVAARVAKEVFYSCLVCSQIPGRLSQASDTNEEVSPYHPACSRLYDVWTRLVNARLKEIRVYLRADQYIVTNGIKTWFKFMEYIFYITVSYVICEFYIRQCLYITNISKQYIYDAIWNIYSLKQH